MFRQELAHLSMFQGMGSEQLDALVPLLEESRVREGDVIFKQGDPASDLFILLSGEVDVRFKPYDGPPLTVARIFSGGVFGWSAALAREVYTSSALAAHDSEMYRISACKLRALCENQPGIGTAVLNRLASAIAERLNNTHTEIVNILTQGLDVNGNCS